MKPRLLPNLLFISLAKRRATRFLKKDVFEYYPKQAERLRGIAEGAQIDLSAALLMQSMELLIGSPKYRLQACTTLGFKQQCTPGGETVVAKNFDYLNELEPYQLTCEVKPEQGYRTLACTMAPLPGVLDGMNDQGLAVTYNLTFTTDKPRYHTPLSMVLQEMLETCSNADEAARFITQAKRGGHDALLTLADSEGDIKSVEISANHATIRDAKEGYVINTNHFQTLDMQQYEIPRGAIYSGKSPKESLNVRVHESSELRLDRAQDLLEGKTMISEDEIFGILRDHGKNNHPSMNTICRHGEVGSSIRSMVFYPEKKAMKVLYGRSCQNEYTEFKFS